MHRCGARTAHEQRLARLRVLASGAQLVEDARALAVVAAERSTSGVFLGRAQYQLHTSLLERVTEEEALPGLVLEAPAVLNCDAAVEHMSFAPATEAGLGVANWLRLSQLS